MRKFYSITIVLLALTISSTAQRRLIKATVSGSWTSASTWTTIGTPTPTDNDSIVIATGVTVNISGNGTAINLQNVIVDIFGSLVFNEPSGTNKTNDLNITTTSNNPVPIVRLSTGATITKGTSGNGTGNIFAFVNSTTTNQLKYSTAAVSGVPAGQSAGPTVTGPAFAQNTTGNPQYFTTGSDAALPVSITLFKAAVTEKNVTLSWTSMQEINTQSFAIEKSTNGSTWQQIGSLPAAGFSTVATKYEFTDPTASAISYYRLKIVEIDGRIAHSNTLVIRLKNTAANLSVFPNPAVNSVNITIDNSLAQQSFTINLLNHNGQLLARRQISGGTSVLSFDLSNYRTGNYTMDILFSGGTREIHKLAIVK